MNTIRFLHILTLRHVRRLKICSRCRKIGNWWKLLDSELLKRERTCIEQRFSDGNARCVPLSIFHLYCHLSRPHIYPSIHPSIYLNIHPSNKQTIHSFIHSSTNSLCIMFLYSFNFFFAFAIQIWILYFFIITKNHLDLSNRINFAQSRCVSK